MKLAIPLFLVLLAGGGPAAQEPAVDLDRALRQAQAELARVEKENRAQARTRVEKRDALLTRLLALEKEERTLLADNTTGRGERDRLEEQLRVAEREATTLAEAAERLTTLARQGARAILVRTEGSLAGLGDPDFAAARRGLQEMVDRGDDPLTALEAACTLALTELTAGRRVQWVTATLPTLAGASTRATLVRVGLVGAAGPAGVVVPEAGGAGWRLAPPPGGLGHRRLRSALADIPMTANQDVVAIPLDVTGGLGYAALTSEKGLWESLQAGGLVMFPIGLVGLLGVLIALLRGLALWREGRRLRALDRELADLDRQAAGALCRRRGGVVGTTLASCLSALGEKETAAERVIDQALLKGTLGLERFLATLGVLGTLAPFLGLLGTVTGMIRTFSALTQSGAKDSSVLAGGIAEALVTTECGLIVAIPLVLFHSILSGRAERLAADLEESATTLSLGGKERS